MSVAVSHLGWCGVVGDDQELRPDAQPLRCVISRKAKSSCTECRASCVVCPSFRLLSVNVTSPEEWQV